MSDLQIVCLIRFMDEYTKRHEEEDDEVFEYDEDGNIVWTWKKVIDPLPSIDHSQIQYSFDFLNHYDINLRYKAFDKNCYREHEEIKALSPKQVFELRIALDVRL